MTVRRLVVVILLALLAVVPAQAKGQGAAPHAAWPLWTELLDRGRAFFALLGNPVDGVRREVTRPAPAATTTAAGSSGGGSGAQGDSSGAMDPDGAL